MKAISRRNFVTLMTATGGTTALALSGCAKNSASSTGTTSASASTVTAAAQGGSLAFDNAKWNYDADNDVYWQIGVVYCEKPETTDYESMGIYVPGAYMKGTANADGTYACTVNASGSKGKFTASTAPIVLPLNTGGYAAQAAPTSYSYDGLSDYLSAGFIYVYAGLRGRDNGYSADGQLAYRGGAPWGATDLKAAVRYYRYNASVLPGDATKMFTFGHSGGGAQSALMGATGDSILYDVYLESIGAAMEDANGNTLSDAVYGTMCWCPITSLDTADAAYEWNMGQFSSASTRADGTWTKALSDDLAQSYADYINALGLKDASGNALQLTSSATGISAAGTYYDYLVGVVETSLNNFLADTTFPYTPSTSTQSDLGAGGGGTSGGAAGGMAGGSRPMTGSMSGSATAGTAPSGTTAGSAPSGASSGTAPSGATAGGAPSGTTTGSVPSGGMSGQMGGGMTAATGAIDSTATYDTAQSYIDALNANETWVVYDAATNTAKIAGMAPFIAACKTPTKSVCAFDGLDRGQAENNLFGNETDESLHFDATIARLLADNAADYSALSGYDASYASAYADDIKKTNDLGDDVPTRVDLYNPMYFLNGSYSGFGNSTVAPHWRIRAGINQGDTALTVETNLALALGQLPAVKDVDFATVWGLGHTPAERTGSAAANFITWVEECC